jgi:hypothetical protein
MQTYVGTKMVKAEPMNELAAAKRGYARKNEDNHEWREGYHVQYTNPDGSVYDSWSPKSVFEKAYRVAETPADRIKIEFGETVMRFARGDDFLKSNSDTLIYPTKVLLSAQTETDREYSYLLHDRLNKMSDKKVLLNGYDFGTAIKFLKAGGAIRRAGWNGKGMFVIKQVPAHITRETIPNMQSLPQTAKDILMKRQKPCLKYTNQMLIINQDGRADSWVPSPSDVFAEDWELVTE